MAVDPEVFAYAMQLVTAPDANGRPRQFNPAFWADVLLWPRATRKSPPFWVNYCDTWEAQHEIPRGTISGIAAAGVLHVIVGAMSRDGRDFNCFIGLPTIAARAHVCERTARRVVDWQRDAASPLVAVSRPNETKGIVHASLRFTLVLDPPAFVKKRNPSRAAHVVAVDARLEALRALELEDQKQLILEQISQAEYNARRAAREREARGKLPKRVVIGKRAGRTPEYARA